MSNIIEQAIKQKRRLKLWYDGHSRIVEPYAFGIDINGETLLMCFQTDTKVDSRKPGGWLFVRPVEPVSIKPLDESFEKFASGYIRNHPAFHTVLIQV